MRKFEILETIDLNRLLEMVTLKEKKIQKLKHVEERVQDKMLGLEKKKDAELSKMRAMYVKEADMKKEVLAKLENLKIELRALEGGEVTLEGIWRQK